MEEHSDFIEDECITVESVSFNSLLETFQLNGPILSDADMLQSNRMGVGDDASMMSCGVS